MRILLASTNEDKLNAVKAIFHSFEVIVTKMPPDLTIAQPFNNNTMLSAEKRLDLILKTYDNFDVYIAIESGIYINSAKKAAYDGVYICLAIGDSYLNSLQQEPLPAYFARFPYHLYEKACELEKVDPNDSTLKGLSQTLENLTIRPFIEKSGFHYENSWQATFNSFSRREQIEKSLQNLMKNFLKKKVRSTLNYPKPGVNYLDTCPLMADNFGNRLLSDFIAYSFQDLKEKSKNYLTSMQGKESAPKMLKIVEMDSRGFLYGNSIALALDAGRVMGRKVGKMPKEWGLIKTDYATEYSQDSIEIEKKLIGQNDQVLIWDDLIATGGTMLAAVKLLQEIGVKTENIFLGSLLMVEALEKSTIEKFKKQGILEENIIIVL